MIFIELPQFTKAIVDLVADRNYADFQLELARHPQAGKVIQHGGGLRKTRMKLPGRGKSGGARVIYLHLPERNAIVLFYIYTKAKSDDLSADQLSRLKMAAEIIKKEFAK